MGQHWGLLAGCSPERPSQDQELQLSVLPRPHPPERGDSRGWRGRSRPLWTGRVPSTARLHHRPQAGDRAQEPGHADRQGHGCWPGRLFAWGHFLTEVTWIGQGGGPGWGQGCRPEASTAFGVEPQLGTVLRPSSVLKGNRLDPQVLIQGRFSCKKPHARGNIMAPAALWWAALACLAPWSSQDPHSPCHLPDPRLPVARGALLLSRTLLPTPHKLGTGADPPQDPAPSRRLPQWQGGGWEPPQVTSSQGKGGARQRSASLGRPGPVPPFLPWHSPRPLRFARPPRASSLRMKPGPDWAPRPP